MTEEKNSKYRLVSTIRVRYAETDRMGIVYNGNYLTWFEIARTELCRIMGKPYLEWEKQGIMLPVVESYCRYKHPAYYDDLIQLWSYAKEIKVYSVKFCYRILRQSDYKLIAEGWTKHAFTDKNGVMYKHEHPFYSWMIANFANAADVRK